MDRSGSGDRLMRTINGGMVYPSLYGAIESNPSGLTHDNKTVVQFEWDPPITNSGAYTQGVAYGSTNFGLGAVVSTSLQSSNLLSIQRAGFGAALGMTGVSLGVNGMFNIGAGTGLDVDVGVSVENPNGIQLVLMLSSIQAFRTLGSLNLGLGMAKPRQYSFEASWAFTLFSPLQQHVIRGSLIGYVGILGIGATASTTTSTSNSSYSMGPAFTIDAGSRFVFGARTQYDSASGIGLSTSVTLAF